LQDVDGCLLERRAVFDVRRRRREDSWEIHGERRDGAPLRSDVDLDLPGDRDAVLADHRIERERLPVVRVDHRRPRQHGSFTATYVGSAVVRLVRPVGEAEVDRGDPVPERRRVVLVLAR
jgi:hypothetical protein